MLINQPLLLVVAPASKCTCNLCTACGSCVQAWLLMALLFTLRFCSDLRLSRQDQDTNVVAVIGANDDGWQHYRINLAALVPSKSGLAGSQTFDQIIIKDVSGMGFYLILDNVQLLLGLSDFKVSEFLFTAAEGRSTALPPVFGNDLNKVNELTGCILLVLVQVQPKVRLCKC